MSEPYLSLVVTARNDDHGGNLLGRMQIFVDGWLTQARRHNIPSELIIVEWNPPEGRPSLAEALRWPPDTSPCEVRIITVPPEIHGRFEHGLNLPLYQMIGKNVGIRRARGQFILATNIDILFSDELAAFLGSRQLRADRMYRIDRHDAMSEVPAEAPIEEQLEYCRTHLIRVNRREGTFEVAPDGGPKLSAYDAAAAGSGILFGDGWFSPERFGPVGSFRWAQEKAEILLDTSRDSITRLTVDLEPGPATGMRPLDLEVLTGEGEVIARVVIEARSTLELLLKAPTPARLTFLALGKFSSPNTNPRTLCFRVFNIEHKEPEVPQEAISAEPTITVEKAPTSRRLLFLWQKLQYVIAKLANGGPLVSLTVPVSPRVQRLLRSYVERGGFTGMIRGRPPRRVEEPKKTSEPPVSAVVPQSLPVPETTQPSGEVKPIIRCPDFLHTNGCGDFTLLAREYWFELRAYPEFDIFSMNIDSVFCFTAHYGGAREEVLADPLRIYHIEHGTGSGWTPEGQKSLFDRIAAKGIPILDNEEVLQWGAQMRRLNSPILFNREGWGLADVSFQETVPGRGHTSEIPLDASVIPLLREIVPKLHGYSEIGQTGPDIDAGLLAAAANLATVRPLTAYPGWRFDSDWESPANEFRMRRFIWTYFHNLHRDTPFKMNWHKDLTLRLHLGNDLSRPIFVGGCIDPNEFAFLNSVLHEGMVFVDAGANEGLYTLFASRCVGPSGLVCSFEPSKRELQRLNCNIQRNGLENVRVIPSALADISGEVELNVADPSHAGQNTLGKFIYDVRLSRTERVSAQTLDGFAVQSGLPRVDVLKLDVEGAERRVLEGSRSVLREMRPIILFEMCSGALEAQGSSASDLLDFMRTQDYRFYAFDPHTGVPAPADGRTASDNMIAVPAERPLI